MSETIKGKLEIKNSNGKITTIVLDGDSKSPAKSSGSGEPGDILGEFLKEGQASGVEDGSFITGRLDMKDSFGNRRISLGSQLIVMLDANDNPAIVLNGNDSSLTLVGPRGVGTIQLKANAKGEISVPSMLHFEKGTLRLGSEPNGKGGPGALLLRNGDGEVVIKLEAADGVVSIHNGLKLENGVLRLGSEPGGGGPDGMLFLRNAAGQETLRLDGKAGDLIFQNADCAEDFDIASGETVAAGTVMVMNAEGRLHVSNRPYDKRVAGVVSGAGEYKPGIILDRQPGDGLRQPIALMGKVFCKVDAGYSPISVGDLLTTSSTPGHAMKAHDPMQAFGAVLGKALRPLAEGFGMIPVLVALQ